MKLAETAASSSLGHIMTGTSKERSGERTLSEQQAAHGGLAAHRTPGHRLSQHPIEHPDSVSPR